MMNKDYKRLTEEDSCYYDEQDNCDVDELYARLEELENAIENGTLVFLSYKTGQEFWWIYHSPVGTEKSVESETVCKVEIFNNNITILTDSGLLFNGNDVFTTKKAAEKALEKLEK